MPDASISKLTVYKLAPVILNATKIPGYKLVADAKWKFQRKDYSYRLFFHKDGPRPPGWLAVFSPLNLNVAKKDMPQTMTSGFILLLEVDAVVFGITGGVGHIQLRKSLTIEHRFGLDLAERIIDLPELRGLTQRDTSGVVNALDRAFRGVYNPQGDINNLKRVLTHVRGTLEKTNPLQATIGKSILASDALTVNGSKSFEDIIRFLLEVNKLVTRGKTKLKIPQLERIDKKAKGSLINQLEIALTKALLNYKANDTHALFLDNEELGYLPDRVLNYELRYQRKKYLGQTFVEVFETVRSLLGGLGSIREQHEALQRMNLEITFDDDHTELQSLVYFICGDITYNNDVYFLNNRQWHRASPEYIELMTRELDNIEYIDARKLGLLEWHKTKYPEEKDFNADQPNFIIMDRRCIVVANEKGPIEFCDLLKVSKERILLIHVKPDTGAALRALFAQGFVSARLYSESDSFRKKIHDGDVQGSIGLTAKQLKSLKSLQHRQRREMHIIFAIFDDAPSHVVPAGAKLTSEILKGALTTFAKIDLLERVTSIRSMGYEVAICRIRPYPVRKTSSKAR